MFFAIFKEVGPTASTQPDVNMVAPEEVMRRIKAAPKAADERTDTDRKRERRHKKLRQRAVSKEKYIYSNVVTLAFWKLEFGHLFI